MTTYLLIGIVLLLLLITLKNKGNASGIQGIDSDGLANLTTSGKVQLIDVRTPGEYTSYHAKGFKNIPLQQINNQLHQIKRDIPVVLMCASGARSAQAASLLAKNGYVNVYNFTGGIARYNK